LKIQDSLAASNQVAEEKISNIRTVKAFSQENKEIFLYGKKMNEVLQLSIKESFMRGLFFAMVTSNQFFSSFHELQLINLHFSTKLNVH